MRPAQLKKLSAHNDYIADVAHKMDQNNGQNLEQVDTAYKETADLESKFISKKMENANLITVSEMNALKFMHNFNGENRNMETLNSQVNTIRLIISMLNKEMNLAEVETTQMERVFSQENDLVAQRLDVTKVNSKAAVKDAREMAAASEVEINASKVQQQLHSKTL